MWKGKKKEEGWVQRYGKRDATIVFADDVRNEGAGIEEGRVYKGIDGRARGGG